MRLRCGSRSPRTVDADVNFIEVSNLDTSPPPPPGVRHAHGPDPNDVAVMTFETPVVGITPAVLPAPGLLDETRTTEWTQGPSSSTVVGYGEDFCICGRRAEDLSEGF